jgi:hypothetical protein
VDALSRAIGAGAPVVLDGRTYMLAPLTLEKFGFCENAILMRRLTPMDLIEPTLATMKDPALRKEIAAVAEKELRGKPMLRIVTSSEMEAWLHSGDGARLTCWLCLRNNHPTRCEMLEDAVAIYEAATSREQADFLKVRNHVSGLSLLCELDWPREEDFLPPEVMERRRRAEAARGYRRANWRLNFRKIIGDGLGGIGWDDIRGMTLYQWRLLASEEKTLETVRDVGAAPGRPDGQKIIRIGNDGSGLKEFEEAMKGHRRGG